MRPRYDGMPIGDYDDRDLGRTIGHDGAGLMAAPIRTSRLRSMQGPAVQPTYPHRFSPPREAGEPSPRRIAAAAIREYRDAWRRITAEGGAA